MNIMTVNTRLSNRKAQALAVVFLATVATGQPKADQGVTTKVDVGQVVGTAIGIDARVKTQVGNFCGNAKGSSEVKAKAIISVAGGKKSWVDTKVGSVGC